MAWTQQNAVDAAWTKTILSLLFLLASANSDPKVIVLNSTTPMVIVIGYMGRWSNRTGPQSSWSKQSSTASSWIKQ